MLLHKVLLAWFATTAAELGCSNCLIDCRCEYLGVFCGQACLARLTCVEDSVVIQGREEQAQGRMCTEPHTAISFLQDCNSCFPSEALLCRAATWEKAPRIGKRHRASDWVKQGKLLGACPSRDWVDGASDFRTGAASTGLVAKGHPSAMGFSMGPSLQVQDVICASFQPRIFWSMAFSSRGL